MVKPVRHLWRNAPEPPPHYLIWSDEGRICLANSSFASDGVCARKYTAMMTKVPRSILLQSRTHSGYSVSSSMSSNIKEPAGVLIRA